jgi:hypothetical protein
LQRDGPQRPRAKRGDNMGITKAERHNKMMDRVFEQARELPSSLNKFYWRDGKIVKRTK